jgi:hypothetical protein
MTSDDEPVEAPLSESLQFDHADFTAAPASAPVTAAAPVSTALTCAGCGQPIEDAYFEIQGHVVCGRCRDNVIARFTGGPEGARFARAALYGIGAAVAGAALCLLVRVVMGTLIWLVYIVAGYMVGAAVRKGSGARGGWRYQVLAAFLTYSAIVLWTVPLFIGQLIKQGVNVWPYLATVVATAFGLPVLAARQNVIGVVIVGVALWQAWRMNRKLALPIRGPFQVGGSNSPGPDLDSGPPHEELPAHA